TLGELRYHGIVTFVSNEYEGEYMHLFSCGDFSGALKECPEGDLVWVPKTEVPNLPGWEGDKIFLRLMAKPHPFFSLKLCYEGDVLVHDELHFYGS
ncbi:MAG: DNA mismatch repair protein MutT, partial [Clostridia bacterium]|nr:DNA mismatch repair protein MutT [Clostridia bacterium]